MGYEIDDMFEIEEQGLNYVLKMWQVDGKASPVVGTFNNLTAAESMREVLAGIAAGWIAAAQEAERFHIAAVLKAVDDAVRRAGEVTS